MRKVAKLRKVFFGCKVLVQYWFLSGALQQQHAAASINHHQEPKERTCVSASGDDNGECNTSTEKHIDNDQCQLYIAQSSIPNSGIGVYTAVSYTEGDYIAENDMLISVVKNSEWLYDLSWDVSLDPRIYYDKDPSDVSILTPGVAVMNCHFGLANVGFDTPEYDSAGLHRSQDPGAGAFTYWCSLPARATRDITAGEELFLHYGHNYFNSRSNYMGPIPKEDDFAHADLLVQKFHSIVLDQQMNNTPAHLVEDLWGIVRNSTSSPEVLKALPETVEDLKLVINYGTARHSVGGLSSIRSKDWLNENGMCVDNMYVSISTIPQAGRGAFAKRFLPRGTVVSPAPMFQLYREVLADQSLNTFQLLLNYVFSHPDSPIFLFPYSTLVNFINHDSQNPNVELRWSTSPLHRKELLDMTSEEVMNSGLGLMMEFVALRDIQPDEEILLNYGEEWERAWLEHVETWEPLPDAKNYISAEDAIQTMGILTVEEQKSNPYPDNVQTACYFSHTANTVYHDYKDDDDDDNSTSMWVKWNEINHHCLRWCSILERIEVGDDDDDDDDRRLVYYDALLLPPDSNLDEECLLPENEKIYVMEIPSDAVTLVDQPLSRDQYISNAFRHYIQLPDDILPSAWRQYSSRNKSSVY
jgi:hypothetical protein